MKILITGSNGMLGFALKEVIQKNSKFEVIATTREDFDITNLNSIEEGVEKYNPDLIINSAAYTNVEKAEEEKESAMNANSIAPRNLAMICKEKDIKFFHISTDYVFGDNNPNGHNEDDPIEGVAMNAYGESKRKGELYVREENPESYILRVQWTFGPNGKNIVDTMKMLAETKDELNIVVDEFGAPTFTFDIANQIEYLIINLAKYKPGNYHLVSEGSCTRYEEIEYIYKQIGKKMKLNHIKLAEYPRKATIPNYSILKNTKLPKFPTWKEGITKYLSGNF